MEDQTNFSVAKNEEFEKKQTFPFNQWIDLNGIKTRVVLTENYQQGKTEEKLLYFTINDLNSLAKVYQSSIGLETEPLESSILKFSLVGSTIDKEVDFINALMKYYIENGLKESSEIATNTIRFVDEQLKDISSDLRATENKMETFKLGNNNEKLQINTNTYIPQSNALEQKFLETQFEYNFYSQLIENLESSDESKMFIPNVIGVGIRDPLYVSITELMSLYTKNTNGNASK